MVRLQKQQSTPAMESARAVVDLHERALHTHFHCCTAHELETRSCHHPPNRHRDEAMRVTNVYSTVITAIFYFDS